MCFCLVLERIIDFHKYDRKRKFVIAVDQIVEQTSFCKDCHEFKLALHCFQAHILDRLSFLLALTKSVGKDEL